MSYSGGGTDAEGIFKFLEDHKALQRDRKFLSPGRYYPNVEFHEEASSQHESDNVSRVLDYGYQAWTQNSKKLKPLQDSGGLPTLGNTDKEPIRPSSLTMALELAMCPAIPNDTQLFLPLGQVETICRRKTVSHELSLTFGNESPDIDRYTDYVCGKQDGSSDDEDTSRKIFAILVITGQLDRINDFLEAGIKDKDLPFRKYPREQAGDSFTLVKRATRKGTKSEPVLCFNNWNLVEKRKFYANQWRLLSPYFDRASDGSVGLYELDEQSIMPWIAEGEEKRGTFVPSENVGGYSIVRQVTIHPDHHAFEAKKFAIKELFEEDDIPFNREFKNLKMVQTKSHLLPVYAAYRQGKHYSFIFPWADGGSLNDLWTMDPLFLEQNALAGTHKATDAQGTRKVITWVASQLAGLTGRLGLGFLHDTQFLEQLQATLVVPEENGKQYGIHGDIKPHNILYFQQDQDGDKSGLGLFKISDFGLTGFHSAITRSRQPPTGPHSPTYRAPEYGVSAAYLSRKYDIWSLGCVFLQFLTWLISGPQGLKQFDNERFEETDENDLNFKEDKFFISRQTGDAGHKFSVQSQIQSLQAEVTEGHYLYDCLELIRTRMLQIAVTERADCKEVHKSLVGYYERCLKDTEYAADTLSTFAPRPPSPPRPPVPDFLFTTYPPKAQSEASNRVNTDQVSNMSAAPTASGVSTNDNAPHTEQTQTEASSGANIDQGSNISASLTISRESTDNNVPSTQHEQGSDQVDKTVTHEDRFSPQPHSTRAEEKRNRSKIKKVLSHLRFQRLVSWFTQRRATRQSNA